MEKRNPFRFERTNFILRQQKGEAESFPLLINRHNFSLPETVSLDIATFISTVTVAWLVLV